MTHHASSTARLLAPLHPPSEVAASDAHLHTGTGGAARVVSAVRAPMLDLMPERPRLRDLFSFSNSQLQHFLPLFYLKTDRSLKLPSWNILPLFNIQ